MTEIIRYARGASSLGKFVAAVSDRGLAMVEFGDMDDALRDGLRTRFPGAEVMEDAAAAGKTVERLAELIERPGESVDLPLDMRGSGFELRVWAALREIPAGRTVSYGEVAARLGSPRAAKEVAEACAANMLAVVVPCHRVVKKDGSISGYRWGFKRKRVLVAREQNASTFQLA